MPASIGGAFSAVMGGAIGAGLCYWLVALRGASRLKREHEELLFKSSLLQAQANTSNEGVLVVDPNGQILSYNRRFAELWGIPNEILATKSDEKALRYALDQLVDSAAFLSRVQYLYEHREEKSRESIQLRDGRTFERYSSPIFGPDDSYFGRVWYFRDITYRKRALEADMLRERAAMQKRFVADASHELRTPLAAIKGCAETLRLWGLGDPKQAPVLVRTIEEHAGRLSKLVENLLGLSALEADERQAQPAVLDLSEEISRFVRNLAPLAKRAKVAMTVKADAGIKVLTDGSQLARVLQILCENAIEYGRRGGRVEIEAQVAGPEAIVTVRDRGVGIPAEELPLVFDRFHRTAWSRAHKPAGTGLGLSIAKTIVAAHGGRIWAESAQGEGSAFHFTLPLA